MKKLSISPSTLTKSTTLASLTIIGMVSAAVLLTVAQVPSVNPVSSASAQGGSGGSGGGGGGTKPTLPADFPTDVPLPAGKLFGSTGVSPSWSVGITTAGSYTDAMAGVRTLYVSNGYTDLNPGTTAFGFENATYSIQVVGQNHDHSNTSTDVTVVVHKK